MPVTLAEIFGQLLQQIALLKAVTPAEIFGAPDPQTLMRRSIEEAAESNLSYPARHKTVRFTCNFGGAFVPVTPPDKSPITPAYS